MVTSKDDFLFVLEAATAAFKSGDGKTLRRIRLAAEKPGRAPSGSAVNRPSSEKVEGSQPSHDFRESFSKFESRERLQDFLSKKYARKTDIEPVMRALRIPVIKTDTYDVMIDKIVDATVGYRLRSQAIRGNTQVDS
jgi:hypothetical protein